MTDDNLCPRCDGSGGGDYPMHCPTCGGRGHLDRTRPERETYHYECDVWDGYEATDAEVRW